MVIILLLLILQRALHLGQQCLVQELFQLGRTLGVRRGRRVVCPAIVKDCRVAVRFSLFLRTQNALMLLTQLCILDQLVHIRILVVLQLGFHG